MTLGEKLQLLRKQNGMSQEQLASQMCVSRQAVSKWELNESLPDTDKIVQLSKIFHVTTDYLLFADEVNDNLPEINEVSKLHLHRAEESLPNYLLRLVKTKGYIAGYIISAYAVLALLLSRFAHFAFKSSIMPPAGFGVDFSDLPLQAKLPLYFINIITAIAIVILIAGILLANYLKKKSEQ
jgi:transcriptional regulator with XRE-family HTH domain